MKLDTDFSILYSDARSDENFILNRIKQLYGKARH